MSTVRTEDPPIESSVWITSGLEASVSARMVNYSRLSSAHVVNCSNLSAQMLNNSGSNQWKPRLYKTRPKLVFLHAPPGLPGFWPYTETISFLRTWFGMAPVNKLVSLTWLLWTLRCFRRFTLHYIKDGYNISLRYNDNCLERFQ